VWLCPKRPVRPRYCWTTTTRTDIVELARLERDGRATLLLVTAELEVLAALERDLVLRLARGALETKDNLLGLGGLANWGRVLFALCASGQRTVLAFLWKTGLV
jgi:hypothetical protein